MNPQSSFLRRFTGCTVLAGFLILFLLCGAEAECPLVGEWAYDYAPDTPVLRVEEGGRAVYLGLTFTWTDDGEALTLHLPNSSFSTILRYKADESGLWIYPWRTYIRSAEGASDGLTGSWYVEETPRVSFIFREDGTFSEDTAFSGTYTADAESGTFTLNYGGVFDPVTCRYFLDGDSLAVAYPWRVVPAAKH
ncbi:MAG: hypothetical protein IKS31_11175 [Clostridia bacterium]|nr:hypothetical protein [Clostridia bacterium]